jgi:L-alanine-DL-glutamate epimerase-like enolase superfamily enzyme
VSAQPHGAWHEAHGFELDRYTQRRLALDNHRAAAPDTPGIGVKFDWQAFASFQSAGEPIKGRMV